MELQLIQIVVAIWLLSAWFELQIKVLGGSALHVI